MIGQCLTETRLIRMPPHFAYDDPNLKFSSGRKPVPPGSTVLYQITIRERLPKVCCCSPALLASVISCDPGDPAHRASRECLGVRG